MGAFSSRLTNTASRLIQKFGQTISFSRTTEGAYDPETSEPSSSSTITFTCSGVPTQFNKSEIDNELILYSDLRLILEKPAVEPVINDVATLDGVAHRVMNVIKVKAEGENIIYILQLRI